MALGKRDKDEQLPIWTATSELVKTAGHPFYRRLNEILKKNDFDRFAESKCARFYHGKTGRPGIPPGVYFRMLMVGYFEGIDSERGIAWRCADSLALRSFLGYALSESTPDHSSISKIRKRLDLETHGEVFTWALKVLGEANLLQGETIGIDATTLEANAAMRSIVRRDTGESYNLYLERLAKESGIETPTREDLVRFDKKRKKKTSNKDWKNPHDPDAKVGKMKDGRTHMSHKAEHAVDLDSGAICAVTLQGADRGDTTTVFETVAVAAQELENVLNEEIVPRDALLRNLVADKGYHSTAVLKDLEEMGIRTYIPGKKQGRRRWKGKSEEQRAVYGNRRRTRGNHGKKLMRKRGELTERSFAHAYETGGMRRTHLRGHENILKRLLIHICGFNLGLLMRSVFGVGTPRSLQDRGRPGFALFVALWRYVIRIMSRYGRQDLPRVPLNDHTAVA